jgi:uncharacterized protein (TIGR03066 family)
MNAFTEAYIEAALWSSTDDDGTPLDDNFGAEDISPETLAEMVSDCEQFQTDHADDIGANLRRAGIDFWLTRNGHGAGYWGYDNPFYTESYPVSDDVVLDYSQPIAVESSYTSVAPSELSTPAPSSDVSTAGMTDFEAAKQSFYRGDVAAALASTNKALAALPGDPIIHEFRALVLFAQGKYQESAAGLYSVLSVGPGWDWTTMSSLYPKVDVYTKQLRALEAYVKQHPDAADGRFVLAYHYLTTGSKDAAVAQLKKLHKELPQDRVIKELLVMTAGPEALGTAPPAAETAAAEVPKIDAADLVGDWMAVSEEAKTKFDLELSKDGTFSWTYTEKGKPHNVKGVYALDRNVLAMEPNSGGVMLAEVTPPEKGAFNFKLLGAPPGDKGLAFEKSGKKKDG